MTKKQSSNLLKAIQGVLAAMFGVQSKIRAEEDFQQPSVIYYVILGLVFTLLFILMLILIVQTVLS